VRLGDYRDAEKILGLRTSLQKLGQQVAEGILPDLVKENK